MIDDTFWTAPIAHCGSLWCLSLNGVVRRVSPVGPPQTHFAILGEDFGQSPFIIRYLRTSKPEASEMPFLIAASTRAIKAVNMLTREVKEIASVSSNESILSSLGQTYSAIETDGNMVYFLKAAGGKIFIDSRGLFDSSSESHLINEPGVVGPIRIGNRTAVYSRRAVHLVEPDRIVEQAFSNGFTAWIKPGEIVTLQPPAGRLPFIVSGDSIYIPGAKGTTAGLLYMRLSEPGAFIPVNAEASFSEDRNGGVVVARKGRIVLYRGLSAVEVGKDNEFIAGGPSYYDEPLTVGFAKTAGGVQSLRFHYHHRMIDHTLSEFSGFQDGLGVYQVGGALVFAYLNASNNIGISAWGC